MTTRTRRLALVGGGALVLGILIWSFLMPGSAPPSSTPRQDVVAPSVITSPAALASVAPSPLPSSSSRRTYALGLHELAGIPNDTPPGTRIELWVTWEPPLTRDVRVQLLVKDVIVERLVPPVVPEGPTSALLSVRVRDIPDLLYGDRFGELSAVMSG